MTPEELPRTWHGVLALLPDSTQRALTAGLELLDNHGWTARPFVLSPAAGTPHGAVTLTLRPQTTIRTQRILFLGWPAGTRLRSLCIADFVPFQAAGGIAVVDWNALYEPHAPLAVGEEPEDYPYTAPVDVMRRADAARDDVHDHLCAGGLDITFDLHCPTAPAADARIVVDALAPRNDWSARHWPDAFHATMAERVFDVCQDLDAAPPAEAPDLTAVLAAQLAPKLVELLDAALPALRRYAQPPSGAVALPGMQIVGDGAPADAPREVWTK